MRKNTWFYQNADLVGATSSLLCVIHCLVFPVLITLSYVSSSLEVVEHWHMLDFIFIGLSFFAVKYATSRTPKASMRKAFWATFIVFSAGLLAHEVAHWMILISLAASLVLMGLHLVNYRSCTIARA
jgi:accessory gene regulator protein AgrB